MASAFHCGQRLSYDSNLCTVRYVGQVEGTDGTWLGVEWDDASRGKHDGQHRKVRYFTCKSKSSTAASFVRPSRPHGAPRTYVQALRVKYASADDRGSRLADSPPDDDDDDDDDKTAIRISGKQVEEVGFDEIRLQLANFREHRIVLLDGLRIAGPPAEQSQSDGSSDADVAEATPKVAQLDLSRNLFESIEQVLGLLGHLPSLKSLRLDGNRFASIASPLDRRPYNKPPFTYIRSLSLNETLLDWQEVQNVCQLLPSLDSLSLCGNEYTRISSLEVSSFPQLRELILERNLFESLNDVAGAGALNALERLSLKACSICSVTSAGAPRPKFSTSLNSVDVSYNNIGDFRAVSELNDALPGLEALQIAHNPVLTTGVSATTGYPLTLDDTFMLTIARLGKLKVLNYTQISEKDRLNAETYYLGQIAAELGKIPEAQHASILERHPRYRELSDVYGARAIKGRSTDNPNTLAARLVRVSFKLDERVWTDSCAALDRRTDRQWVSEIPGSFSIYAIQGVVGKRLGLLPMLLRLVWETGEEDVVGLEEDELLDEGESHTEDDHERARSGGPQGKQEPRMREEVLAPRLRPLNTWIEGKSAVVRVEWSEQDKKRCDAARGRLRDAAGSDQSRADSEAAQSQ